MGIFIRKPETERVGREVAALRGTTITGVIDALAKALDAPLLYKGDGFPLADVRPALAQPI